MGCPPVRGDNPRALASGLSYVQVDKRGITSLYHLNHVDLAHHEIFCAKVGKGGINCHIHWLACACQCILVTKIRLLAVFFRSGSAFLKRG